METAITGWQIRSGFLKLPDGMRIPTNDTAYSRQPPERSIGTWIEQFLAAITAISL
jgi:hypothetical protein